MTTPAACDARTLREIFAMPEECWGDAVGGSPLDAWPLVPVLLATWLAIAGFVAIVDDVGARRRRKE